MCNTSLPSSPIVLSLSLIRKYGHYETYKPVPCSLFPAIVREDVTDLLPQKYYIVQDYPSECPAGTIGLAELNYRA